MDATVKKFLGFVLATEKLLELRHRTHRLSGRVWRKEDLSDISPCPIAVCAGILEYYEEDSDKDPCDTCSERVGVHCFALNLRSSRFPGREVRGYLPEMYELLDDIFPSDWREKVSEAASDIYDRGYKGFFTVRS